MDSVDHIARGHDAQRIMTDPQLVEAFDEVERHAVGKIISADPLDHETRAAWAAKVRAVREVRQHLTDVITTGRLAD